MSQRIVKTCRWSPEEWAEVERAAGVMAPASWVREAALAAARRGGVVSVGAPAALGKVGTALAVRADVRAARGLPPEESAGSSVPVPPAGGVAGGVGSSPSSGPAPLVEAVPSAGRSGCLLVDAVAAGLAERFGARADHPAAARRMVSTGRVSVDGVVVSDCGARISGGEDLVVA